MTYNEELWTYYEQQYALWNKKIIIEKRLDFDKKYLKLKNINLQYLNLLVQQPPTTTNC